ncbi:SAM dependent carboxyl methyltransferase [Cynara cardunculus var. scolymus]|uniref:SAM dependent carboxyl methyltransferase n=1 Tax=Cynara cardunculus var. scolymus TaxID=59895 RepID=A0A103Y8B5_CYNCS|nr:SAM dependent carboxyl methyltransferase [Cynara cardunculus var. scolymus]
MESSKSTEAYPMKGGDGVCSYTNNSSYQKSLSEVAMSFICEAVAEKLAVENLACGHPIRIADLGCSIGPNTFIAVENIINSVQIKYETLTISAPPDFQVFFNDHISNDFNTLFKTLPANKQYFAAGVPGSFYGRLFPRASIHVFHSSFALHWLSKVPKEVTEKSSGAWNKGRVHYGGADDGVIMAFRQQYMKDMEGFLKARADEVVCGGLVVVLMPGRPNEVPHCECIGNVLFEVLGCCLLAMAKQGKIAEETVESLNIPIYYASPQELEEIVDRNGCFTIERMEGLAHIAEPETKHAAGRLGMGIRVGVEGIFKGHLQDEMIDELFESYTKKLEQAPSMYSSGGAAILYSVLRRKGKIYNR